MMPKVGTEAPRRSSARVWGRRIVVVAVVATQLALVVRAYDAPHAEFGFQMFSESSDWQADIVRVTADGRRVPIDQPWYGYEWPEMVTSRGLSYPSVRTLANGGVDNQLGYLRSALDWVADNTPRDTETRYLEAVVTYWRNTRGPTTVVLRSQERAVP